MEMLMKCAVSVAILGGMAICYAAGSWYEVGVCNGFQAVAMIMVGGVIGLWGAVKSNEVDWE